MANPHQGETPGQLLWRDVFHEAPPGHLDDGRVQQVVNSLTDKRQQWAVAMRYGLGIAHTPPLSYAQMGRNMWREDWAGIGISAEMARRILQQALRELRAAPRRRALREAAKGGEP